MMDRRGGGGEEEEEGRGTEDDVLMYVQSKEQHRKHSFLKKKKKVLIHGAFSRCYLFTFLTVMNRHFCKYYISSRQPDIHGSDVCVLVRVMRYDRYHDTGRTIQYTDKDYILIQLIY